MTLGISVSEGLLAVYKDPCVFPQLEAPVGSIARDVQSRVEALVGLRQLLRGRSPCDTGTTPVSATSFKPDCLLIQAVLPHSVFTILNEYQLRMLKKDVVRDGIAHESVFEVQQEGQSRLRLTVQEGIGSRLFESTRDVFSVAKDNGAKQRLIVDARRSNGRFLDPPRVSLLSGTVSARIELYEVQSAHCRT